jgi:hypothetical protein
MFSAHVNTQTLAMHCGFMGTLLALVSSHALQKEGDVSCPPKEKVRPVGVASKDRVLVVPGRDRT